MSIQVDMTNPPAYVVLVSFFEGNKEVPVTWPFETQEAAAIAYALAVGSGQFERVLRKATKKQPAFTVSMVSMWRREYHSHAQTGGPVLTYVGCEPWHWPQAEQVAS